MGATSRQTALFSADQSLPYLIPGTIVHLGVPIALIAAVRRSGW